MKTLVYKLLEADMTQLENTENHLYKEIIVVPVYLHPISWNNVTFKILKPQGS